MKKYIIFSIILTIIALGIFVYAQQPQDQFQPQFSQETQRVNFTEAEKKTTSMRASRGIEPKAHTESFVATEDIPTEDKSKELENFPQESDEELVEKLK